MKARLESALCAIAVAIVGFLLMTSAACPDGELLCLVDAGQEAGAVVGDHETERDAPRASGARPGSELSF